MKHDELVEEIAKKLWAIQAFPGATDWGRAEEKARGIITLILSAVRDGLPLLDEVGRVEGVLAEEIIQHFFPGREGNLFIALSGTSQRDPVGGKEEEEVEDFIMTETEAAIEGGTLNGSTGLPQYCEHCGSEEHYTSEHY